MISGINVSLLKKNKNKNRIAIVSMFRLKLIRFSFLLFYLSDMRLSCPFMNCGNSMSLTCAAE